MQARGRRIVATASSLALHGALALPAVLGFQQSLDLPEIKIEFETIDMVELAPDQELAEVEAPVSTPDPNPQLPPEPDPGSEDEDKSKKEEEPEDDSGDKAKDEKEKKPKRALGDRKSRVDQLGPANSRVYALLATRRVARLPYAEQAVDLLAPWPDFEFIVQGAGFHPLRDFNAVAVASSDMRDASQTFLAVDSRLPMEELKAGIERAAARYQQKISWEIKNGITVGNPVPLDPSVRDWDPRYFALIDKRTAVYVRQEFLPAILAGPKAKKGKKTAGNFVANIARLRRFVAKDPNAGVQVVFKDIRAAIKSARWPFPFDIPNGFELFGGATANPELVLRIEFLSQSDAKKAVQYWEKQVGAAIRSSLTYRFMVGPVYDSTEVSRDKKVVTLKNTFSTAQTKLILSEIAKLGAKQQRKSPEDIKRAKQERRELWNKRKGGRLTPSQALKPKAPAAPPKAPTP